MSIEEISAAQVSEIVPANSDREFGMVSVLAFVGSVMPSLDRL